MSGKPPFSKRWDTTFYDILKGKRKTKAVWQCVKFRIIRYYPPKGEEPDSRGIHINLCKVCVHMCDSVSWFLFVLSGLVNTTKGIYRICGFFLHYIPMPSLPNSPSFSILIFAAFFSVELQSPHHLTAFTKYLVYRLPIIRDFLCESDASY